jgi:hypothetical protein
MVNMDDLQGIHKYLATMERAFRGRQAHADRDGWRRHLDWLAQIQEQSECGESQFHRAQRLGEEIALWLDDPVEVVSPPRVAGAAR